MSEYETPLIINNTKFLLSFTLILCIFLIVFEFGLPYFFQFYLERYPNYNDINDLIPLVFLHIFIFLSSMLFIGLYFFKEPWRIEISYDHIILRNLYKKERKFLIDDIRKIDKIQFNNEGLKTWTIIGKRYFKYVKDGNKIPLAISNKVGEQLRSEFDQIKQRQRIRGLRRLKKSQGKGDVNLR